MESDQKENPAITDKTLEFIRKTIYDEFERRGKVLEKFILFGSRARNDHNKDSDWDLLAVLQKPMSMKEKLDLWQSLALKLSEHFISCDLIIKGREEYHRDIYDKATVTYYVLKEGVPL